MVTQIKWLTLLIALVTLYAQLLVSTQLQRQMVANPQLLTTTCNFAELGKPVSQLVRPCKASTSEQTHACALQALLEPAGEGSRLPDGS